MLGYPRSLRRPRLVRTAVALGVIAAALVVTAQPASATHSSPSYYMKRYGQNLCVDVPNGNAFAGQFIQQWGCNWSSAQIWSWKHVSTRWDGQPEWYIRPKNNLNLCLSDTGDGNVVVLKTCDPGHASRWLRGTNGSLYTITSTYNGWRYRCLNAPNGWTNWGLKLRLSVCNGSLAQNWVMRNWAPS